MARTHWNWIAVALAALMMASGCAREAEEKVAEAGQNLEEAWQAERAAAAEEMHKAVDAISEDIQVIRERAARLEAAGAAEAAKAWHATADKLAAARDAAKQDIRALEEATADGWQAAHDKASAAVAKLDSVWETEKAAIAAQMRESIDEASEKIEAARARAAELEQAGAEKAAAAWHRMGERLASARDAAAEDVEELENAAAGAWHAAADAASDSVVKLGQMGRHAEAFAAATKDAFVAGARRVVEMAEKDLTWAKEKLANADDAAKEEWHQLVTEFEEKQQVAAAELRKVEEASGDAWADMAHGFVAAYHDLHDAGAKAIAEFEGS